MNLYTKQMNGGSRATKNRVDWTVVGLNVLLPIYDDVAGLQHVKKEASGSMYINRTTEDVEKLTKFVVDKLGVQDRSHEEQFTQNQKN